MGPAKRGGHLYPKPGTRGRVVDANNGRTVAGVTVRTADNQITTTDANGDYRLDSIKPGIIFVSTFAPGYGRETRLVDAQAGESVQVDFRLERPTPKLAFSSPENGAQRVGLSTTIKLVFDQPMDAATFNPAAIVFFNESNGVSGTYEISGDTLIFRPDSLAFGANYTLRITSNLENTFGVGLERDTFIRFSTVVDPVSVGEVPVSGSFMVYPNPAGQFLNVVGAGVVDRYVIYSASGLRVQSGRYRSTIDLSAAVLPGVYWLGLIDRGGRVVGWRGFVRG